MKLPHFLQKLNIPQTTYLLSFWRKSNILRYIFQPRAYNLTKKLSIGIFKCHYLHSNLTYQLQINIYLRIIHLQHTQTFSDDLLFLYQWGMLVHREILRSITWMILYLYNSQTQPWSYEFHLAQGLIHLVRTQNFPKN